MPAIPTPRRITDLARDRLGLDDGELIPYGHHKAKLSSRLVESLHAKPPGRLVLVTAISPTPAGEGKTTTTIGLADALNRIGARAVIALREPSLGPVFGVKGGATGGGRATLAPMDEINLHFTGDFAAVAAAHNLLAALVDNHLHHGNALGIDPRRVSWRRVVDMNDRALRGILVGLGGPGDGVPRQSGFDIVVASEIMAILCLADGIADLKTRLGEIVVARRADGAAVRARELGAVGAMAALLRDARLPNLVQSLEGTPALVHLGPFANIAHGCNSVSATRAALALGDYAITEAGFGADLGAEKFVDIKCRVSGLRPSAAVLVATVRALKYHGGVAVADVEREDLGALERGLPNLERHLRNLHAFGLPVVVAINHRTHDTPAEIDLLTQAVRAMGAPIELARHWADGGAGAESLARAVVAAAEPGPAALRFVYDDDVPLWDKMAAVATRVYGASGIEADAKVRAQVERLQAEGCGAWPVCVAKTQSSFSTDPALRGAPTGHVVRVREVRLAAGARFVVMVCGDVMTMPGLPKEPAAHQIDLGEDGRITGLF